jgi:phosphonate transport system substrate-binding protein
MAVKKRFLSAPATLTLVIILFVAAGGFLALRALQTPKVYNQEVTMFAMGLANPVDNRLHEGFSDADANLVADSPEDSSKWIDPDILMFSYVASAEGDAGYARVWSEFITNLAEKTGKKVNYLKLDSPEEMLLALKQGRLHAAGLNTGGVPIAVNDCGFVPFCTPGNESGQIDYSMQIIVPKDSDLTDVRDLRGRTLTVTHKGSNSGYKAPLVILMNNFGLQPERDFYTRKSPGHDASIRGVADGTYEAAAIASDLLKRAVSRGDITEDQVRVLYESERFVSAAIGHLSNLKPSLAESIRDACSSFEWEGTGLVEEFGPAGADRFVPVDYKNDWALVRHIDNAIGYRHVVEKPE